LCVILKGEKKVSHSNTYTFIFIIFLSAFSALVLSISSQSLKEKQNLNIQTDIKKNILSAVGLKRADECDKGDSDAALCCNVLRCYDKYIIRDFLDSKGNSIKKELDAGKIDIRKEIAKPSEDRVLPLFARSENGRVKSYCIPVAGRGLWGPVYGYLAFETDFNTVKGLTFYKHSETPGLGAEIEEEWFLDNFKGKKILNRKGELVSVSVVKGKTDPASQNILNEVDGISGATITSDAVTELLKNCLILYEPYFMKHRKGALK